MRALLLAAAWLAAIAALASGSAAAQGTAGAGAVALCLIVYRDRRGLFLAAACLAVLLLAWLRWDAVNAPPPRNSVAWLATDERRVLIGRVESDPEMRGASQRLSVEVGSVETDSGARPANGSVQIRVAPSLRLRKGDRVRMDGTLEPPPVLEGFDYPRYLARRGIFAVMEYPRVRVTAHERSRGVGDLLGEVRERAHAAFWRDLPAQQAALADGMLIGRRSDIPREVNESFQRSGVSHLIVISGFNIALVAGMVMAAAGWVTGRRWAALIALAAIGAYGLLVGFTPPVARAALMGGVAILALLSGRPHGGGAALVLAAALLTVPDPRIIEDISFQLSVAATAGLILLSPPMLALGRRLVHEDEATFAITWRSFTLAAWDVLAVTLAATIATLPILLASFGRLSAVSPLTNLLLVPLFPLVIVAGAVGLSVALIVPPLGAMALAPVGGLLELSIVVARAMASLPGASLSVTWFTPAHAAIAYCLLGVAAFWRLPGRLRETEVAPWHIPTPLSARPLPLLAFVPATILLALVASTLLSAPSGDGETTVTVLGLPSTTASLVRLSGGGTILVDTGAAPAGARTALDRELNRARGSLTAVVITRDAPSAPGGLAEVLARWQPPLLLVPPESAPEPWADSARAAGVTVQTLQRDLTLGGADSHLHVEGARDGQWRLSVRHGPRRISLGSAEGDAFLTRSERVTRLATLASGTITSVELRQGETGTLSTDGRSIRLTPPRGRVLTAERCPSACSSISR